MQGCLWGICKEVSKEPLWGRTDSAWHSIGLCNSSGGRDAWVLRGKGVTRVAEAAKEGRSHWCGEPTWSLRAGPYSVSDTVLSSLYVYFNFILTTL